MSAITLDKDLKFKLPAHVVKRLTLDAELCETLAKKLPQDYPTAADAAKALRAMLPAAEAKGGAK